MRRPYPSNINSTGNVSDDDVDALSPTDGYFHASPHHDDDETASSSHHSRRSTPNLPRRSNVLVEDPTLAGPDAKAREAQAESQRINTPSAEVFTPSDTWSRYPSSPSHHQHHHHSHSHSHSHSPYNTQLQASDLHSTGFNQHRDAPPAYTPSPTPPSASGYQTFGPSHSTMGLPEEQQRLIPHPPESMGGLGPVYTPNPSRWQRIKASVSDFAIRKKVKTALGVLVVLSVIAVLLSSTLTGHRRHNKPNMDNGEPIKSPDMDDSHDDFTWNPSPTCRNSNLIHVNKSYTTAWSSDRDLKVVQKIDRNNRPSSSRNPHVTGEVIVVPTDGSSGYVDIQIITNDESIDVSIEVSDDEQEFTVATPAKVPWNSGSGFEGPCIQIRITIRAPKEATLGSLTINTVQLGVNIKEDLNIELLRRLSLTAVSGDVKAPAISTKEKSTTAAAPYKLSTREVRISTTSGQVKGWYPLFDVLDINSVSGDIIVDVTPKPADPEQVKPAVLRAYSTSGDIKVEEDLDFGSASVKDLPERDYTVELTTASGDITAKVVTSSFAQAKSQSGDLNLVLLPVLSSKLLGGGHEPFYRTETTSSDAKVSILEPIWTGRKPESSPAFGILSSKHASISGDISLVYPSSWEGRLTASTTSGSQKVHGEGLVIDSRTDRPWSRYLQGHKGEGRSQLEVRSISGDQDILIGN